MRYGVEGSIEAISLEAQRRVRKDFDLFLAVCGDEGTGKSTCAINIARAIDPNFTVERNVVIDPDIHNVTDKLKNLPRYTPIIWDEAVKVAYKHEWQSKSNIHLKKVYAICRKLNQITIACMPSFDDFDKFFRERRIHGWVEVVSRGNAVFLARSKMPIMDRWFMDDNYKLLAKAIKTRRSSDMTYGDVFKTLRKFKNYAFEFKFDDLPKDIKKEYLELTKGIDLDFSEGSTKTDLYKSYTREAVALLYMECGLKTHHIAQKLNMSTQTVHRLLKDSKIEPLKMIKAKSKAKV